ncbi:MAG: hypothetical protein WA012_12365 [Rhodoferax sp.]|jgi:hypothetical protein|uniref:hypothetical protein n=1 Tax=Rhodoferax sp. TaxID=50421 RepID=UPI003BB1B97E
MLDDLIIGGGSVGCVLAGRQLADTTRIVSGNTSAPVIMIAEKAATMIKASAR